MHRLYTDGAVPHPAEERLLGCCIDRRSVGRLVSSANWPPEGRAGEARLLEKAETDSRRHNGESGGTERSAEIEQLSLRSGEPMSDGLGREGEPGRCGRINIYAEFKGFISAAGGGALAC